MRLHRDRRVALGQAHPLVVESEVSELAVIFRMQFVEKNAVGRAQDLEREAG